MREVHGQGIRIETDRRVEFETRRDRRAICGRGVEGELAGDRVERERRRFDAVDGGSHGTGDRLFYRACPACRTGGVGFHKLEGFRCAVAGGDWLVRRRKDGLRRAGFEIGEVLEAEAIEPRHAGFEEGDDGVKIVERLHTVTDIIPPAGVSPDGVPFLEAGTERDDLGFAFGAAAGMKRDGGGETDFVEVHVTSLLSFPAERQRGEGNPGAGHRMVLMPGSPSLARTSFALAGDDSCNFINSAALAPTRATSSRRVAVRI